jgi:hypothetical protein
LTCTSSGSCQELDYQVINLDSVTLPGTIDVAYLESLGSNWTQSVVSDNTQTDIELEEALTFDQVTNGTSYLVVLRDGAAGSETTQSFQYFIVNVEASSPELASGYRLSLDLTFVDSQYAAPAGRTDFYTLGSVTVDYENSENLEILTAGTYYCPLVDHPNYLDQSVYIQLPSDKKNQCFAALKNLYKPKSI